LNVISFTVEIMNKISARAPGRINIIGEHTDYNKGYVLPAAINLGVEVEIESNGTNKVHLQALDLKSVFTFDLQDERLNTDLHWTKYGFGVVKELQKLGALLPGFNAQFSGDVPRGSGMSSSAALECSLAFALNQLFNLQLNDWDLIKAGQLAEHNYVGTKCGIMDQFSSILGKKDQAIFLDCLHLNYEYVPLDLMEYELLLLNTNVAHSLADSEYNTRRTQCEEGVHLLKQKGKIEDTLRDVKPSEMNQLKTLLPSTIFKRCQYVIEENERVLKAKSTLQKNDLITLGKLMFQSHEGLKNLYEVSCEELDFLVDCAKKEPFILGSRMMGGGFGGSTISIIKSNLRANFVERILIAYKQQFGIELSPYSITIEDGAHIIST